MKSQDSTVNSKLCLTQLEQTGHCAQTLTFLDVPGGTGKCRSIAVVPVSVIKATLLACGRSAHSALQLLLNMASKHQ